jgi:hypothetical protein
MKGKVLTAARRIPTHAQAPGWNFSAITRSAAPDKRPVSVL